MNILRRKFFIYPEIQTPLILILVISVLLLSVIQIAGVYIALKWMAWQVQADISIIIDHRVLGIWKWSIYLSILIPIIFNIFLSWFIVLFISNRFAGPLFRIERELDRYLNKDIDQININLRDGDYLKKLAQKINQLSEKNKT